jgi:hypothetical protein
MFNREQILTLNNEILGNVSEIVLSNSEQNATDISQVATGSTIDI